MGYIYAYTLESYQRHQDETYNSRIKVGYTSREPQQRVDEQDGTSLSEPIVLLDSWAIKDGFDDHDVHDVLETQGYRRSRTDKDREWFNITVKDKQISSQLRIINNAIQIATSDLTTSRDDLYLTSTQYRDLEDAIEAYRAGQMIQLHEKCARFGKTLWAMILFMCLGDRVMVVATYWLSALSSFENDIVKFKEFINLRYVDSSKEGWAEVMQQYLDEGLKVVVGVSLHAHGEFRESKKQELLSLRNIENKFVFIDEADFGAHKASQKEMIDWIIGNLRD